MKPASEQDDGRRRGHRRPVAAHELARRGSDSVSGRAATGRLWRWLLEVRGELRPTEP